MDRDTLNVQRLVRSLEREMQRPLSAAASDVVMIEVSGDASETTNGSDNDAYYTTMATLTDIRHAQRLLKNSSDSSPSFSSSSSTRASLAARLDALEAHFKSLHQSAQPGRGSSGQAKAQAERKAKLEALRPKAPATVAQPAAASSLEAAAADVAQEHSSKLAEGEAGVQITASGATSAERSAKTASSPPAIVQDLLPLGEESDADLGGGSNGAGAGAAGLDLSGAADDTLLSSASSRVRRSPSPSPLDTSSMSTLLSHHRSEQDSLSSELAQMASALKANSLAFSTLLEKDKQLLGAAEEKLEGNLVGMTGTRERLKGYSKKGGVGLWFTIGATAAVAIAWFFMFALMRVL